MRTQKTPNAGECHISFDPKKEGEEEDHRYHYQENSLECGSLELK